MDINPPEIGNAEILNAATPRPVWRKPEINIRRIAEVVLAADGGGAESCCTHS